MKMNKKIFSQLKKSIIWKEPELCFSLVYKDFHFSLEWQIHSSMHLNGNVERKYFDGKFWKNTMIKGFERTK